MRTLLVASAGGHFEELRLLRERLGIVPEDSAWVTWDTPQTRAISATEETVLVEPSDPRDWRRALTYTRSARRILRGGRWDRVISTGALIAVPFLTVARSCGVASHYIESAARITGPSLSGRMLEWVPGVRRYGQWRTWALERRSWSYRGSVFDAFAPVRRTPRDIRRVVVTLGTSRYGFTRLTRTLRTVLPSDIEVVWQVGRTDTDDLGSLARSEMPQSELAAAMSAADLVIAHAGVGTALRAMEGGHCPVLVPRRKDRGEHVDDHQLEIAEELTARGLAHHLEPEQITFEALVAASGRGVTERADVAAFVLDE